MALRRANTAWSGAGIMMVILVSPRRSSKPSDIADFP
jgi:hypothetical protein